MQTSQAEDRKRASDSIQSTELEWRGEGEQGVQTESACYLEAGARTCVLVPQHLNVRVFHSLLPRSVTPSVLHAPSLATSRGSDVMRLHAIVDGCERQGACVDMVPHSPTGTDLVASCVLLRLDDLPLAQASTE